MVSVPIFDTITGLFTGKTKTLSTPSSANTRTPGTTYASQYPYNYSQVTRAGHEIQLDDTPGNERVRIAHKSGSYTELSEDGRKVEVVTANESKTVKQSTTITIEKNGDIKIGGAARIVVGGDAHLEVKGDVNQVVGGNYNLTVGKNYNLTVDHDINWIAKNKAAFSSLNGTLITANVGDVAISALASDTTITAAKNVLLVATKENVAVWADTGNYYVNAKGDAKMFSEEGQAGIYGLKGSAAISGNTYVAIRASGSDKQDPTGANPPAGGELRMSGNVVQTYAKSINAWDTYGAGYVYKYISGSYSIKTYTNGVPSTSSSPNPPHVPSTP